MKTLFISFLAIISSAAGFSQVRQASNVTSAKPQHNQARAFQSMIGSWEIVGEQESGAGLEVIDSTTILIRFLGEEKKLVAYKLDYTKSPYWFDFSAKDGESISNFKSLIEFVNDDMLKWQVFVDEERSNHFTTAKGELFYLKKAKSKPGNVSFTNAH